MSRSRSHRSTHGGRAGGFLALIICAFFLGGLTEWTPIPDGVVGFLAIVSLLAVGLMSGHGHSGHSRGRSRSRSRRRYR